MNQSALDGFVKIVEMDSFSAAAEALYLSQSALSQQIRTLEGQLQFELFQHVPRRVILTPAGRDFYPKAKQLTALYQEAVRHARAVQQQENPPERHLVIAWSHEAMRMFGYDLFSLTNELCLQYTSIMMQCASRSEVWRSLKKGRGPFLSSSESAEFYAQGFDFHPAALCAGAVHSHPPARRYAGGQAESGAGAAIPLAARQRDVPDRLRDQPAAGGAGARVNFTPVGGIRSASYGDPALKMVPAVYYRRPDLSFVRVLDSGQGTPVRHRAGTKARGPGGNGLCPRVAAAAAVPLGKAVRPEAGTGGGIKKKENPLRRIRASSPEGRALLQLTGYAAAKPAPLRGSWHRVAMTER
mgnify:CR=1 FL=1